METVLFIRRSLIMIGVMVCYEMGFGFSTMTILGNNSFNEFISGPIIQNSLLFLHENMQK